ncbi:MAG TPA: DNA-directed RNA polymerase subunit omega [Candidatus Marinimicrobia bacterium]|nr:DNA-directed RNA polymerase subunit omega [Candidatus Neomarinimicrobiota bacterium]
MTSTLDFSKLTRKSDDIYELVVAASKRARQIAALRIAEDPLPTLGEGEEETFEVTPEEIDDRDWDGVEKPTTAALSELIADKLEYRYASVSKTEKDELEDLADELEE